MLKVKLSEFEQKKKKKRKKVAWAVFYKFFLVTSTVPLPKRNQPAGPVGPAPFGTDSVWLSFLQGYEFSRVLWAPFCSLLKGRRENFMLPHTPRKDAERSCSTCYPLLLKTHACERGVLFYLLSSTTNDFWSSNIGVFSPLTQNTLRSRKWYLLSFTANRSFRLFFFCFWCSEGSFSLSFSSLFFIFLTTTLLLLLKRTLLVISKRR